MHIIDDRGASNLIFLLCIEKLYIHRINYVREKFMEMTPVNSKCEKRCAKIKLDKPRQITIKHHSKYNAFSY